jgi:hypothetical protein
MNLRRKLLFLRKTDNEADDSDKQDSSTQLEMVQPKKETEDLRTRPSESELAPKHPMEE